MQATISGFESWGVLSRSWRIKWDLLSHEAEPGLCTGLDEGFKKALANHFPY